MPSIFTLFVRIKVDFGFNFHPYLRIVGFHDWRLGGSQKTVHETQPTHCRDFIRCVPWLILVQAMGTQTKK